MNGDKIPKKLHPEARILWRDILRDFNIDDSGGFAYLKSACESLTEMRKAQAIVKREGVSIKDKWGQIKAHPLLPYIRDCRSQYLMALKGLALDVEPLRDRPSKLTSINKR